MFRKIVDVIKEVFWIKPSRKRAKPSSRKAAKRPIVKKAAVKKKTVKKPASKPVQAKSKSAAKPRSQAAVVKRASKADLKVIDPALQEVGVITHYFDRIKVCVVKLTQGTVLIGDKLTILGPKTKFVQKVWSMQIESVDVKVAKKGQLIGLKVDKMVVVGDKVYK